MNTRIIGCHLSVAKGVAALGKDARQIGANTFQFHSRNPRGGAVKKRTDAQNSQNESQSNRKDVQENLFAKQKIV